MLKEEIIVTTHLRNAAGVCALSIGLLVCSSAGAIAYADQTETGGVSDSPGGDTKTADRTTNTTSTTDGPTNTEDAKQDDDETGDDGSDSTVTVGTTTGTTNQQSSTFTVEAETNTVEEQNDITDLTGLNLDGAEAGVTPSSTVVVMPSLSAVPAFTLKFTLPSGSNKTPQAQTKPAAQQSGGAPASKAEESWDAQPLATREPGPITTTVVTRVSNAFASVAQGLGYAVNTLAQLPTSQTPITDVIKSIVAMVGGVVGAVIEVASVPGDLVSLLGVKSPDSVRPPLIGNGGTVTAPRTLVDLPFLGPDSQPHGLVPALKAPLSGTEVQPSSIGGAAASGLKNDLTLSGLAPVPSGISPATTSFLDHVVSSVLAPASLMALAAIAVPGVAGLLIVCVAGIRVGYRQAKAGLALRVSGIARFAGPGPMGVVRSGGLIALHTRTPRLGKPHTTRAARAKTANAPRLLESVA
ncbi:hypothetical protein [Mycolicibacterium tusciae]|uniref:hypothetical protein n=1 Tax=Mycolicibacterium tusciae TaxID=75922 RepID=UPI00024A43B3|nr:hypothetical protein [Mycolicibacterium tusciae]